MYWSHVLVPAAFVALSFVLSTVFGPWSVLPLLPFVLRFPNGDVLGWRRRIDPFVWAFLGLAYVLYVVEWRCVLRNEIASGVGHRSEHDHSAAPSSVAGLILAKNVATATPSDRQRLGFLAIGTFASFLAYAIYYVPGVPFAVGQVVGFAVVLMPICIAYAVFRLRVLDVNFVLNRALVYGVALARRDRVRLDLGLVLFARRRDRAAGDRGRIAGDDRRRLFARSNQSR